MATITANPHRTSIKGLISRATLKKQTKNVDTKQLLQNMEALKIRISTLRQQCEEIRTTVNIKPTIMTTCCKCGKQLSLRKALIFKTARKKKTYCKECFAEMWK